MADREDDTALPREELLRRLGRGRPADISAGPRRGITVERPTRVIIVNCRCI